MGWTKASRTFAPFGKVTVLGTSAVDVGVCPAASISVEAVIPLKVEPGSNVPPKIWLLRYEPGAS